VTPHGEEVDGPAVATVPTLVDRERQHLGTKSLHRIDPDGHEVHCRPRLVQAFEEAGKRRVRHAVHFCRERPKTGYWKSSAAMPSVKLVIGSPLGTREL
jgi:hypothetical protein